MSLKGKSCLVMDRGDFLSFAQALYGINGFDKVLYFSPWQHFMAKSQNAILGRGMYAVERVDSFWDYVDEVDTIAFVDVGDGDWMHWLRKRGYNVWGCGRSEMLEMDRWQFRKLLEELGQPIPDTTRVIGFDALRKELKDREECYIKTSYFRGDFETLKHVDMDLTESWIKRKEVELGPHAAEVEIIIEEPIESECETGIDTYCIDDQFPENTCWGFEKKDQGYIIKADTMADMPAQIRESAQVLAPSLKALGCRGNFHTEIRIGKEGEVYILDPAIRPGSPPAEVMECMIENWGEIVEAGARGELVEPEFSHKYGCQIILKAFTVLEDFLLVKIPDEYAPYLKLRRGTKYGDQTWCVPTDTLELFGSACGVGDTPEESCDMAKEVADSIEALECEWKQDTPDELLKLVKKGEECLGVEF